MKLWVRLEDSQIVEGPIGQVDRPDGFVEYVEVLNLPPDHGPVQVTVELVDGRCVKTITAHTDYRVQRRNRYPSTSEQLDMLWHAMDDGALPRVEPFYGRIKAVKDQHPKPANDKKP